MRLFFDPEDFDEIRRVLAGVVDFSPGDEQIVAALADQHELVGSAFKWGWSDSAVRSGLACALVDAGLGGFLPGGRLG